MLVCASVELSSYDCTVRYVSHDELQDGVDERMVGLESEETKHYRNNPGARYASSSVVAESCPHVPAYYVHVERFSQLALGQSDARTAGKEGRHRYILPFRGVLPKSFHACLSLPILCF